MKVPLPERLLIIVPAAIVTLWAACLIVMCAWALDSSGVSTLSATAAALLAVSAAMGLGGRVVRVIRRLLVRMGSQDALAASLEPDQAQTPMPDGREHRAMLRLQTGAIVFAAMCGLGSTAAVYGASFLADALVDTMVWSQTSWTAVRFLIQFLVMGPMALGICLLLQVGAMTRSSPTKDMFADTWRDWLWAVAVAMAGFVLVRQAGLNIFALSPVFAVALSAAAIMTLQYRRTPGRAKTPVKPIAQQPKHRGQGIILATYAGIVLVVAVQVRLLGDVAGLGMSGRVLWAGGSLAMLVIFLGRKDRESRPLGKLTTSAATVALAGGVMLQGALAMFCAWARFFADSPSTAILCGFSAIGLQIPLVAITAVLLCRHRLLFVRGDGQVGDYAAATAAGSAVGLIAYGAVMSSGIGALVLFTLVLGLLTAALIGAIAQVRGQLKLAVCGAVLMCSLSAAVLGTSARLARRIQPGVWLSTFVAGGGASPTGSGGGEGRRSSGVLPRGDSGRSEAVNNLLEWILTDPSSQGRWWIVSSGQRILSHPLPKDLRVVRSALDPFALPAGGKAELNGGDFFIQAHAGREHFDGVLLAGLRADHSDAWRFFNERTLRRCLGKIRPGGVILLRTRVSRDQSSKALAVAETFRRVIGSGGWAAIAIGPHDLDILLAGPGMVVQPPAEADGLFHVSLDELRHQWADVRPVRIVHPAGFQGATSAGRLEEWLQGGRSKSVHDDF